MTEILCGRRILVTRPESRAGELLALLRAAGAEPVAAPTISTATESSPAAFDAVAGLAAGAFDWVAFTSAAAVDAIRDIGAAEARTRGSTDRPGSADGGHCLATGSLVAPRTRVAAVGPATAAALDRAGVRADLVPTAGHSAAALAAAWPAEPAGRSVLLPHSDLARDDLDAALTARGYETHPVVVYRTATRPLPPTVAADLAAGLIDAVLVTSPSACQALVGLEIAPGVRVVAIGDTTARALRDAGLPLAAVADRPSGAGLVAALARSSYPAVTAPGSGNLDLAGRAGTETSPPSTPVKASFDMRSLPSTSPAIRDTASTAAFPTVRLRRLRRTPALRRLVAETRLDPADLILPMFVREGLTESQPLAAMPGVTQHSLDSLRRAAEEAVAAGVGGLMLFGVPETRDAIGSGATDPAGILNVATAALAADLGDSTVLMADLCLDEFTDHGHCGVLADDGTVDNDATLARYADMGVALADAGAHLLGTSGMMDGQVGAVRRALDAADHSETGIIAYAAKYASACYGPFREAVDSQLHGDRRTYQMDPGNGREATREVALDVAEGADIVIVKPASWYLDILAQTAATSSIPVAAYQVSGEYAMIMAAAERGWINRDAAIMESLTAIRRAGADMILTYFATEVATRLAGGRP